MCFCGIWLISSWKHFIKYCIRLSITLNWLFNCGIPAFHLQQFACSCHCPWIHRHLAWYVKLRDVHAPGMSGTFSPPPRVNDPDMYHGKCVTHVPWCTPGSVTSDFLPSGGKRSRHSRCIRNPQFYVSAKRPMTANTSWHNNVLVNNRNRRLQYFSRNIYSGIW